jgi:hypothetical protein
MKANAVVIAITKHGIDIACRIMQKMPEVQVYAQKFPPDLTVAVARVRF